MTPAPNPAKYEYVKVRGDFNFYQLTNRFQKWFFGNKLRFVWNMGLYHLLIIVLSLIFGQEMPGKVIIHLGMGDVSAINAEMNAIQSWQGIINNLLFLAIILFLDFALLIIIKSEFNSLKLTYGKIIILEIFVFMAGVMNPYVRTALFFFGANTLQIAIAYKWFIKKWIGWQYFFVAGSSVLIVKLLIYAAILAIWGK